MVILGQELIIISREVGFRVTIKVFVLRKVDHTGTKVRTMYHKDGKYQDNFTQEQDQISPFCSIFDSLDNITINQLYY